jgi:hypothetical protein
VGNPYSRVEFMDHTTMYDDAHVERQVSPDEGDDVDHGDDSQDIPQPIQRIYHSPKAPTLPV